MHVLKGVANRIWRKLTPRQWLEAALSVPLAFFLLWLAPKFNPLSDSTVHLTAKVQAALVGGYYPDAQRDQITVLLIDDASLNDEGWPVRYGTHARWLRNLGSVYKPRAVFIDITFTRAREDETLPSLVDALCGLHERGIPVYLAGLVDDKTHKLFVRPGLQEAQAKGCFDTVYVNYESHKVDRLVWDYALRGQHGTHGIRTAPLAIAQDVAGLDVPEAEEAMALTWGIENRSLRRYGEWCRRAQGGLAELIPPRLRLWDADALKPACPYAQTVVMSELKPSTEAEEAHLHERLDGRIVMIGASLDGFNDQVATPLHGDIPGVFMHAMALDNLLTAKGNYNRAYEWEMPPAWPLFWVGVATVLVAHFSHLLFKRGARKWNAVWARRIEPDRPRRWYHKAGSAVLKVLPLVFRILATGAITMGFILLVQHVTQIGTLPLVDLALMALAAEWFEVTEKIFGFFEEDHPAVHGA